MKRLAIRYPRNSVSRRSGEKLAARHKEAGPGVRHKDRFETVLARAAAGADRA